VTYLVLIIALVFLLSIQTTFLRVVFPGNIVPDLILIVAVYSGIHLKKNMASKPIYKLPRTIN